jgi:hypothetical protein
MVIRGAGSWKEEDGEKRQKRKLSPRIFIRSSFFGEMMR